jgi:hypothetical protein
MSENQQNTEMDEYYRRTRQPLFRTPSTRPGKIGCGLLVVLWFCVLTIPFVMFWLASGQSITIPRGGIPEAEQHPRWQMSLIMDADNRGFQFTNTSIERNESTNLCVETHVNYLLWVSEEEQNAVAFCDCYERSDSEADWVFVETLNTTCNP